MRRAETAQLRSDVLDWADDGRGSPDLYSLDFMELTPKRRAVLDEQIKVARRLRTAEEALTDADRELAERLGLSRPHPMPASDAEAEAWIDARDAAGKWMAEIANQRKRDRMETTEDGIDRSDPGSIMVREHREVRSIEVLSAPTSARIDLGFLLKAEGEGVEYSPGPDRFGVLTFGTYPHEKVMYRIVGMVETEYGGAALELERV